MLSYSFAVRIMPEFSKGTTKVWWVGVFKVELKIATSKLFYSTYCAKSKGIAKANTVHPFPFFIDIFQ